LGEAEEEGLELRLMSDRAFHEEFDIVVDEIAARYVAGQFEGEEKERVERYFLRSPERQRKVKFMFELHRQMALSPGELAADNSARSAPDDVPRVVVHDKPGLWDRVRSLWTNWPVAVRAATAFAVIAIVAAGGLFIRSMNVAPSFVAVELAMTSADRSAGAETPKVSLPSGTDELRLKLKLPTPTPTAKSYRATIRGERHSQAVLTITEQTSDSVTVVLPARDLTQGTYLVELAAVNDGAEPPWRGTYVFKVE
jgi:hypothetical protein